MPHLFSLAFEKAVRDGGLPPIRLHDLRHTHVAYGVTFPAQHQEAAQKFAALVEP